MTEQIGKVKMDYSFYQGVDCYNDGDEIEEKMLHIVKNNGEKDALCNDFTWPILYHLSDLRKNLLEWYPFEKSAEVLEIGSGCGAITGELCSKTKSVTCIELSKRRSLINAYRNRDCDNLEIIVGNFKDINMNRKFDYITLIGVLEYAAMYIGGDDPYSKLLLEIKQYLKPTGKIIIAIENKMGFKYLNGAKEDHVGQRFAGIEDYRNFSNIRTFSKPELSDIINNCGFRKVNFYYPSPDYKVADTVFSDRFMPKQGSIRTWNTNYSEVRLALYNEAIMADQICKDKLFDYFSNSFLAVVNDDNNEIIYSHYRRVCKKEYQTKTVIRYDKQKIRITKSYIHDMKREYDIFKNMEDKYSQLQKEYICVKYLYPQISKDELSFQYEYIEGESLEEEVSKYVHNTEKMLEIYREIINKYYEYNKEWEEKFTVTENYKKIFGDSYVTTDEKTLKITNIDLLLQNLIIKDEVVYCFDYEWIFDFPIPYEYVIYRSVIYFYEKYCMYFARKLSRNKMLNELGVKSQNISVYDEMEKKFQEFVYGREMNDNYLKNYVKPCGMIELKGI